MKYLSGRDIYILLYSVSERTWKKGSVGWKWSPWWFRFSLDFQGLPNLGYSNLGGLRCAYFSTHLHTAAAVYQLFFLLLLFLVCCLKDLFIYPERQGKRERKRERHIGWLPLTRFQLGIRPAIQACALTGNRAEDLAVCRPALHPLSHTSQGTDHVLK